MFRTGFARCPLDGEALQELADDRLVGATFADRYVIEDCIGEGGMGRVYRARHQRVSRRFAIKVLFGEHATDKKMRDRFAREAEAASRLQHPNVISVVDFGETPEGLLYLVMDYVEGRELREIIDEEGPLDPDRAAALCAALAAGLGHAHDEGLVHRDFKPENVIVTRRGGVEVPRIVDFGIAVLEEPDATDRLTTEGLVLGTPAYMAPEQACGAAVDSRTDLFALGVLLYEMLAGVGPFDGPPLAIARQNLSKPAPPIAERVPGLTIDARLEAVAQRLMAKKPEERFASARQVVAALERLEERPATAPTLMAEVVAEAPSEAAAEPEPDDAEEAPAPRRRSGAALLAVALAVAVALALALFARGRGERAAASPPAGDAGAPKTARAAAAAPPDAAPAATNAAPAPVVAAPPDAAAPAADAGASAEPGRRRNVEVARRSPPPRPKEPAPTVAKKPISQRSLTALYVDVGEGIEAAAKKRGEDAVAALRRRYRRIPFQDALRKPSIRAEVEADLHALRRQVRRIERR